MQACGPGHCMGKQLKLGLARETALPAQGSTQSMDVFTHQAHFLAKNLAIQCHTPGSSLERRPSRQEMKLARRKRMLQAAMTQL